MLKETLWSQSVPRVELDQRARAARLRLERIERLLAPHAAVTDSWFKRALCLFSFGIYGEAWQGNRTKGSLSCKNLGLTSRTVSDVVQTGTCRKGQDQALTAWMLGSWRSAAVKP